MADTPFGTMTEMEVGQAGKETVFNEALRVLEALVAGYVSISVAGSVDVTLTDGKTPVGQAKYAVIRLTGVLTGNINVIVPTKARRYLILNGTTGAFSLTVKTAAGTGVSLVQPSYASLYCDGINVLQIVSSGGGSGSVNKYVTSFVAQTTVTITGATHGLATSDLQVSVYDTSSPKELILPASVTINTGTFTVVVTFGFAQSGSIVLIG